MFSMSGIPTNLQMTALIWLRFNYRIWPIGKEILERLQDNSYRLSKSALFSEQNTYCRRKTQEYQSTFKIVLLYSKSLYCNITLPLNDMYQIKLKFRSLNWYQNHAVTPFKHSVMLARLKIQFFSTSHRKIKVSR